MASIKSPHHKMIITPAVEAKIVRLINEGVTVVNIKARLGCSENRIRMIVNKHGLKIPKPHRHPWAF